MEGDEADNTHFKPDKYLLKMCNKKRLLELLHDFVLFDGGVKKLPRVHQYFGVKAAEERVNAYQGGIIWHTQGSGKSIVMVLLAKWILENKPNARVLILRQPTIDCFNKTTLSRQQLHSLCASSFVSSLQRRADPFTHHKPEKSPNYV
jgi:SWI2/SNF2 ATPase